MRRTVRLHGGPYDGCLTEDYSNFSEMRLPEVRLPKYELVSEALAPLDVDFGYEYYVKCPWSPTDYVHSSYQRIAKDFHPYLQHRGSFDILLERVLKEITHEFESVTLAHIEILDSFAYDPTLRFNAFAKKKKDWKNFFPEGHITEVTEKLWPPKNDLPLSAEGMTELILTLCEANRLTDEDEIA
jgi:hypothetical protein